MKRSLMVVAGAIGSALSAASWACGACDEDKVAATYDHAVVDRAVAKHYQVVFVAIDGSRSAAESKRRVAAASSKVRGVVTGTLRTSLAPTAFSFALDRQQTPEAAVSDFRRILGDEAIRLTLLRVMRDGSLVEP